MGLKTFTTDSTPSLTLNNSGSPITRPKYQINQTGVYADDPVVQTWAIHDLNGRTDSGDFKFFKNVPGVAVNSRDSPSDLLPRKDSLRPLPIPPNVPPYSQFSRERIAASLLVLKDIYGITDTKSLGSVIAEVDYISTRPDELSVQAGDVIHVLHVFNDGWCFCVNEHDKRGTAPLVCLGYPGKHGSTTPAEEMEGRESSGSARRLLPRLTPVRAPTTPERKSKRGILNLLELLNFKRPKAESPSSGSSVARPGAKPARMIRSALKGNSTTPQEELDTSITPFPLSRRVRFGSPQIREFEVPADDEPDNDFSSHIANISHSSDLVENSSSLNVLPPTYEESLGARSSYMSPSVDLSEKSEFDANIEESPFHTTLPLADFDLPAPTELSKLELDARSADLAIPVVSTVSELSLAVQPSSPTVEIAKIRYQNLLSTLLAEVSVTDSTGRNDLRNTLMEYSHSLQLLDPVTSLVRSREYRANLLQVASALDIFDEPKIREALQADENEIADTLHFVSHSESYRQMVLALEGDEAQQFLDVVQAVLDKGYLLDDDDRAKARRLLVRLSETCDKLPSSLFIKGVEKQDSQASFGGGFGDVYRASYNGQLVALKRMRIFQRDPGLPNIRRRFCREALLWQHLNNQFIVPFLGIDAESFPSFLCMVSPWMRHGTILKYLAENGRAGIDKRLHEVAQGLAYLHSQRIVHGDLRGSNILINENWQACLTDFGLTVFNDATAATFTSRHEGSVRWMAPELHIPSSFGLDRFRLTPETDVYSFGCVCLELYTGRPPFPEITHDPAVMMKVIGGERPQRPSGESAMSDQLWQTVEMCWSHHFADRLKTEEVVQVLRKLSSPPSLESLKIPAGPSLSIPESSIDNALSSSSTTVEEASFALANKATQALVASHARLPYSLTKLASLSLESLNIERLPLFPSFPSLRPFPSYPPSSHDDSTLSEDWNSDGEWTNREDDGEDKPREVEEFMRSTFDMPKLPPLRPSSSSSLPTSSSMALEEQNLKLGTSSTAGLSDELKDYWDIIRNLDVALDTDFSLNTDTSSIGSEFPTSETSRTDEYMDRLHSNSETGGQDRREEWKEEAYVVVEAGTLLPRFRLCEISKMFFPSLNRCLLILSLIIFYIAFGLANTADV